MVILTGTFDCHAEHRSKFVAALATIIESSRAEAGCLEYAVSGDLWDENRFYAIERWQDVESFEAHGRNVSGSDWSQVASEAVRSASVLKWESSDVQRLI